MDITDLRTISVGEGLPVGIKGSEAELAALAGATVTGRISVNGGAAVEKPGRLFTARDARGFIGVVPFTGDLITAEGKAEGVVIVTKAGEDWNPWKRRFTAWIAKHV